MAGSARRVGASVRGTALSRRRDSRVDALRGVALLVMFMAETAPPTVPSWLTFALASTAAPLFALLIGIGASAGEDRGASLVGTFVRAGVHACLLVALGVFCERWGAPGDIVLFALALPTLLAPFLARLPTRIVSGLAVVCWAATPVLRGQVEGKRHVALVHGDDLSVRLWDALITGAHFRSSSLLVMVCVGVLVWRAASGVAWHVAAAGLAASAVAGLMLWAHEDGNLPFGVNDGSRVELGFDVLAAAGLALIWMALAPRRANLSPLSAAGSMTLTVYVIQFACVESLMRPHGLAQPHDAWLHLALLVAGGLMAPMFWRSVVQREPWAKGPIEGPTALVTDIFR